MRLAEQKRKAAILLFGLPTRGFPCRCRFRSSPLLPSPLTPLTTGHILQSVNPHLPSFVSCLVSILIIPLVSSLSRPLCSPSSPRTMALGPIRGFALVFVAGLPFSHPNTLLPSLLLVPGFVLADVIKVRLGATATTRGYPLVPTMNR